MKKTQTARSVFLNTTALYQATFVAPYRPFLLVGAPKRQPVSEAA